MGSHGLKRIECDQLATSVRTWRAGPGAPLPTQTSIPMTRPRLCIWWDTGKISAALTHPPTENVTRTGTLLDSNLAHADEWPSVAKRLARTTQDECFSVSRGWVLRDVSALTGVVVHGPVTNRRPLALIVRRFGLRTWKAEQDVPYFTETGADRLLEDGQ